jgi:hypothetical protein
MKYFITALVFSLLLLALPNTLLAGHVLKVTDTRSGKTQYVKPGARLVYQLLADSSIHDGELERITAFEIQVDGQMLSLTKIKILYACSKGKMVTGRVFRGVGRGLSVTGQAVTFIGVENLPASSTIFL